MQDLAGDSIGWKTLPTDDNVSNNSRIWQNTVDNLQVRSAPQALSTLADTIIKDFLPMLIIGDLSSNVFLF